MEAKDKKEELSKFIKEAESTERQLIKLAASISILQQEIVDLFESIPDENNNSLS